MKHAKIIAATLALLCTVPLAAQKQSVFSAAFDYGYPLSDGEKKNSMGGSIGYEFEPFSMLGLYANGFYRSIALKGNIDPLTLYGGEMGASFNWYAGGRIKLHAFAGAGIYEVEGLSLKFSGVSETAGVGISFLLNPGIAIKTTAAYTNYTDATGSFMKNIAASAGITFNFKEQFTNDYNIGGQLLNVEPVFPVLYTWYEKNKFADFEIVNYENADIKNVTVSFYQEQFMQHPAVCTDVKKIKKGGSAIVPLTAFFDESIMNQMTTGPVQAKVIVSYSYMGQRRTVDIPVEIVVYLRNSMSWADDRRAAVFVSSNDPNVIAYSKMIQSIVREQKRAGVNDNLQYGVSLFQSLSIYGLNYVVDPSSSYADNVGKDTIDFLQFPYQTLSFKAGDCDDLSILNCALIDAAGIDCAFITVPGHIYIAFDTGVDEATATRQFGSLSNLIVQDGKVWLPLEITLTHNTFVEAWTAGAQEWNKATKENQAKLYPMSTNRLLYTPANVPGVSETVVLPDEARVVTSLNAQLDVITKK